MRISHGYGRSREYGFAPPRLAVRHRPYEGSKMRRLELFLVPVLLVTVSLASGQEPSSAMKLQGRPKKVATEWASGPSSSGTSVVQTGVTEGQPGGPMVAGPITGPVNAGPVHSTSNGQCGSCGCGVATCESGTCGATCGSYGHGCCLSRIKEWFCSRPLNACDKRVCYDPIPPLYQFFPCPRVGYCPRLAPPSLCPAPVHLFHPVCHTNRAACCNTSCGSCGSSCGTSSCGTSAFGSCSACESGRGSWTRFFSSLRGLGCKDHCCTPSAQCFTNGQTTQGCASGNCGPK